MDIKEFFERAEKRHHAVIVTEEQEAFAMAHIDEIHDLSKFCHSPYCNAGILVRMSKPGVGIHVTNSNNVKSILVNGMKPSGDMLNTFGEGVIYAAPDMGAFDPFNERFAMFRCWYGAGALRAIATYDKEKEDQGEIIIPPECLLRTEFVCYGDIRNIQKY